MSFILDALKKADAERQLGETPGIHTPQTPTLALPGRAAPLHKKSHAAVTIGVATAITLVIGLVFWQATKTEPAVSVPPQARTPAPIAAVAPQLSTADVKTQPKPAPEPLPATELPVPPPLPDPERKRDADPAAQAVTPRQSSASPAPKDVAGNSSSRAGTAARQPRIMSLSELPADVQRELPSLAVKGSMYSEDPANRMLLLDKRLLHEGDEIAPGLVLETLMPKAATLRYKQYRFQITF